MFALSDTEQSYHALSTWPINMILYFSKLPSGESFPRAQITSPFRFGLYNNGKTAVVALYPGRSTIGHTKNDTKIGVLDPRQNEFDVTQKLVISPGLDAKS